MDNQNRIAISQYDLRQVRLMYKKIDLFENRKIDLFDLVCDLTGLLNALESMDESWKRNMRTEINTLEMIYDCIVDGSILKWQEDPKEVERNSVLTLKKLTFAVIDSYLKWPDKSISTKAEMVDSDWLMCPNCAEAWESTSQNAMVVCPKCNNILHNPRYLSSKK